MSETHVKEAVQGRVLTEEERAQLEYTRKVKRNEDILRRRLLEQSPEDFIAAQERLLQDGGHPGAAASQLERRAAGQARAARVRVAAEEEAQERRAGVRDGAGRLAQAGGK